jgi:hypothetical protein
MFTMYLYDEKLYILPEQCSFVFLTALSQRQSFI